MPSEGKEKRRCRSPFGVWKKPGEIKRKVSEMMKGSEKGRIGGMFHCSIGA